MKYKVFDKNWRVIREGRVPLEIFTGVPETSVELAKKFMDGILYVSPETGDLVCWAVEFDDTDYFMVCGSSHHILEHILQDRPECLELWCAE